MTSERVRTFLGVWAPLILGGLLILFAMNFFVNATTPSGPFSRWPADYSWDVWRSICTGGLIFVAIILGISTLGRYRKTKEARRPPPAEPRPPQVS